MILLLLQLLESPPYTLTAAFIFRRNNLENRNNFEDSDGQRLLFDKYNWLKPVENNSTFCLEPEDKEDSEVFEDPPAIED